MSRGVLEWTPQGIHCPAGGFTIDPRGRVPVAVITHAHRDHLRLRCGAYHVSAPSLGIVSLRLGRRARVEPHRYGERFVLGRAAVSLHPAGHILGSAQVRVEVDGEVWVVSGDYKRQIDPSCEPFEVVRCDTFVTEATFARSSCVWEPAAAVARRVFEWWEENRAAGRAAIIFCYALGKAQRILAELARFTERKVWVTHEIEPFAGCYREAGAQLLPTGVLPSRIPAGSLRGELVLAPLKYNQRHWYARFGAVETALISGWMGGRGAEVAAGCDRGFVLSDHADWPELLQTISETGARRVLVTHGEGGELIRYLRERGVECAALDGS